MDFFRRHKGLFRGLTSVFTVFLLISVIVSYYATGTYQAKVDSLLGTKSGSVTHSDDIADYTYTSDYDTVEEVAEAEAVLVERIEEEGAVLLKGTVDDIAVGTGAAVTLFGIRSYKLHYGGTIGAVTNTSLAVSLDEALEDRGISVNQDMIAFYKSMSGSYSTTSTTAVNEVPQSEYASADLDYTGYQDAAIVVLGRVNSEGSTYLPGEDGIENPDEFSESLTGNILGLSDDERDLIEYVKEQGFSRVIVLLNSSCAMEIEELKDDEDIDAILLIGNPGAYGTYGIADILTGDAVPSGHLTDTYAVNSALSPAAQNFDAYEYTNADDTYTAWYEVWSEDIYVGYKYYETRYYDTVMEQGNASVAGSNETVDGSDVWDYDNEVSYAFGYGVEGSTFSEEIVDFEIDWSGETDSSITILVTNTGDRAAKHVVQLYVSVPYTEYDQETGLEKSAIQLIGYGKTGEAEEDGMEDVIVLEPGESEEVTITFDVTDFTSYDSNYSHDGTEGAYILEEGTYYFATGNGAHEAVQAVIKAQDATKLTDVELTGVVYEAELEEAIAFTVGEDGETLIENQLEDMDFTYEEYGDAFTSQGAAYLSRSDWSTTFPVEVTDVTANDYMLVPLNCETYDAEEANADYDGVVYTAEDFGTEDVVSDVTVLDLFGITDYDDPLFEEVLSAIPLEDYSLFVTGNNTAVSEVLLERAGAADSPAGMISGFGMSNDERPPYTVEAGDDSLRGTAPSVYAAEPVLAATFSHKLAQEMGTMVGNDALWIGVFWWYAPGLNLHRTPYNARNNEYYSEDAVLTGLMASDVIQAVQEKGVVVCIKHFAFNDIEKSRTGVGAFTTEQAARENELRGFQIAMTDGGAKSVMTAFNRVGVTYCGAHSGLITGILRGEWGFEGLVITDSVKDTNYMRVAECLAAGVDFMLGGNGTLTGAWSTVDSEVLLDDAFLTAEVREAYHRYLYTFADSALFDGYAEDAAVTGDVWWVTTLNVMQIGFGLLTALCLVAWVLAYTGKKEKEPAKA